MIIIALGSLTLTAQNKIQENRVLKKEVRKNYTPEQRAELRSKKMTLLLDLTEVQQEKVKQVFLKMDKSRQEATSELPNSYEHKNARMDQKIALKKEMKDILSSQQFEKWEKSLDHQRLRSKRGRKHLGQINDHN